MEYLIHIGTNKTGTSSLQSFIYSNKEKLLKFGVLYPEIGIETSAHHNFVRWVKTKSEDDQFYDDFRKSIDPFKPEKVLFSSESFHTLENPDLLLKFFPKGQTKIVVYIREHAAYLSSWYQQALQARNTSIGFDEFIQIFSADYKKLITKWVNTFGKENVFVRNYNREDLYDRDIVSDFLSNYLEFDKSVFKSLLLEKNPSIAGNLLYIKRILNQVITKQESLSIVYEIVELTKLKPEFKGKIALDPQILAKISFLYREDRKWLKKNYGISIEPIKEIKKGHLFPDMNTLKDDLKLVYNTAETKNFKMKKLLDRIRF